MNLDPSATANTMTNPRSLVLFGGPAQDSATIEKVKKVTKTTQNRPNSNKVEKSKFPKSCESTVIPTIKLPTKKRKLENPSHDEAPEQKRRATEKSIQDVNNVQHEPIDIDLNFDKTICSPKIDLIITAIENVFKQNANRSLGLKQTGWMRDQFPFLGISTPDRRKIQKSVFKEMISSHALSVEESSELIRNLIGKNEREFHYAAIDVAKIFINVYPYTIIELFEEMIKTNAWWDTVDDIASNLVGNLVKKHPSLLNTMDNWIEDSNLWLRRTALIFQLKWKNKTDVNRLLQYCKKTMHEDEFFIQKAIGWALREYSKTDKKSVNEFLNTHRHSLSSLSYSEASKHI